MPDQQQSVTFVASRAKMISVAIALFVGTAAIITMFMGLLRATLASHLASASESIIVFILLFLSALIALFIYIDIRIAMILIRPTTLTINLDGIRQSRNGQIVSEAWADLGQPEVKWKLTGQGSQTASIVFMHGDEEGLKLRSDIYPQTSDQILAVIEDAMARGHLELPEPPSQRNDYLIIVYSVIISAGLAYYVWFR